MISWHRLIYRPLSLPSLFNMSIETYLWLGLTTNVILRSTRKLIPVRLSVRAGYPCQVETNKIFILLQYKVERCLSVFLFVCLFIPKNLANRWTDRVLPNRVASHSSRVGLKIFWLRLPPPPQDISPLEKNPPPQKKIFI